MARALIALHSDTFIVKLTHISDTYPSGRACLKAYISACRDALDGGGKLRLCVTFCIGPEGLGPDVLARLDGLHRVAAAWLSEVVAAGQSDNAIVDVRDWTAEAQACLVQTEVAQLFARAAKDVMRFNAAVARLLDRIA